MKFAGGQSWQATIDTPHALVAALHLRDAAGLDVATGGWFDAGPGRGSQPGRGSDRGADQDPASSAPALDESDFRPGGFGPSSARLYGYLRGRPEPGDDPAGPDERFGGDGGGSGSGEGRGGDAGRGDQPDPALAGFEALGREVTRDPVVPPLDPAVPYDAALVPYATATAAEAWRTWWSSLLNRHPEFRGVPPLVPDPFPELPIDLRALIGIGLSRADAWFNDRKARELDRLRQASSEAARADAAARHHRRAHALPLGGVVRQVEREQGHSAAPFDLLISILPVHGRWAARVRRDHVLISGGLADYDAGVTAFLGPVVRDLAQ